MNLKKASVDNKKVSAKSGITTADDLRKCAIVLYKQALKEFLKEF